MAGSSLNSALECNRFMLQKHISCGGSIILRIWSQMHSNHQPLLPSWYKLSLYQSTPYTTLYEVGEVEGQCQQNEFGGHINEIQPVIICTLPIFTFHHDLLLDQLTGENVMDFETIYLCSIDKLTMNTNISADISLHIMIFYLWLHILYQHSYRFTS